MISAAVKVTSCAALSGHRCVRFFGTRSGQFTPIIYPATHVCTTLLGVRHAHPIEALRCLW